MGMNIFIGGGGKQLQMNVITSNKNMMHHVILRTVIEVVSDVHKQIPCLKKKIARAWTMFRKAEQKHENNAIKHDRSRGSI